MSRWPPPTATDEAVGARNSAHLTRPADTRGAVGPRQVSLARQMYDELGDDGKRQHAVQQIADEFGVTRRTIYRHLGKTTSPDPTG
jgi:predicted transcriptional regulator YheO